MKNGKFETQAEIYQALLNGKKIRCSSWLPKFYIHLIDGSLRDDAGIKAVGEFYKPTEWELCQEPRETIDVYESFDAKGISLYCSKYGFCIDTIKKEFINILDTEEIKKNIITPNKPKFKIYADTFEVVREGEDEN